MLDNNNTESRSQNPSFKYNTSGEKLVTLRVITDSSCQETIRDTIRIFDAPIAGFITGDYCEQIPFQVQNNSFSVDSIVEYRYIFSNDTSYEVSPEFVGDSAGEYQLQLLTTTINACKDSLEETVVIHPSPIADFAILNNRTGIPFALQLQNRSQGAERYYWDFGNGDSSGLEVPAYTYRDTGRFPIQLIAESEFGCLDTSLKDAIALPYFLDAAVDRLLQIGRASGREGG